MTIPEILDTLAYGVAPKSPSLRLTGLPNTLKSLNSSSTTNGAQFIAFHMRFSQL